MKPGWRTSELTFTALSGTAIFQLASQPCENVPTAVVRAAACVALGLASCYYCESRVALKREE